MLRNKVFYLKSNKETVAQRKERELRAKQYSQKMNLPVPVLAEPQSDEPDGTIGLRGEARESTRMLSVAERQADRTTPARNVKNELDSSDGQTPSVAQQPKKRVAQQKKSRAEYFRKYRKKPKLCPYCGKEI